MRRMLIAALMLEFVIAVVVTLPKPVPAATPGAVSASQTEALDRIGRLSVAGKAAPGVTIAVARNGTIVYAKGFGYRNIENSVAAAADTRYPIGSNTKQFTAAAILTLQDEGKLDVGDRLSKYLPEIPHSHEVTLRNLLTHAGGYAEFTAIDDFDEIGNRPTTLARVVATVDGRPLSFVPGTKRQYSNTGYELLSMVIERVSKMTYGEFLARHFFEPLGMSGTYLRYYDDTFANVATEYESFALGPWEHAQHIEYTWFAGAGAIVSSARDLVRWNAALDGGKVLSPRSLTEMITPITLGTSFPGYGFGIMATKLPNGHRMIAHGGNTEGAASQDARFPDDGLSIVVLSNGGEFDYNAAVSAIYDVFVPPTTSRARKPSSPVASGPKADPAMVRAAERWLDDAVAGRIDLQKLRPSFRARLLPQRRAALRALAALGPRRYQLVDVDRRPPSTGYVFALKTAQKPLLYAYGRDDNGLVAAAAVIDIVNYARASLASPAPVPLVPQK